MDMDAGGQCRQARGLTAEVHGQYVHLVTLQRQFPYQVGPTQGLRRRAGRKFVRDQQQTHQRSISRVSATASRAVSKEKWRRTLRRPLPARCSHKVLSRQASTVASARPAASLASSTSRPCSRKVPSAALAVATTGRPCAMYMLTLPLTPAP